MIRTGIYLSGGSISSFRVSLIIIGLHSFRWVLNYFSSADDADDADFFSFSRYSAAIKSASSASSADEK